jgi:hypothetical protein
VRAGAVVVDSAGRKSKGGKHMSMNQSDWRGYSKQEWMDAALEADKRAKEAEERLAQAKADAERLANELQQARDSKASSSASRAIAA